MEKTDMKYPIVMEEPKVSFPLFYFASLLFTHLNSFYLGDLFLDYKLLGNFRFKKKSNFEIENGEDRHEVSCHHGRTKG